MDAGIPQRFVISVLVADRVGILRDITRAVASQDGTIDGISQTVVEGYFTVILTASFARTLDADALRSAVTGVFPTGEASVVAQRCTSPRATLPPDDAERYILTLSAEGHPSLLKDVTSFLAEKGINVEDWFMEQHEGRLTHIGEITVPARLDVKHVQDEFRALLAPHAVDVALQHENIFRVTNEIGAVSPLLRPHVRHA